MNFSVKFINLAGSIAPVVLSTIASILAGQNEKDLLALQDLLQLLMCCNHHSYSQTVLVCDQSYLQVFLSFAGLHQYRNEISPCQIEIIHKVYPPVIHVLYACVYMLRIHLMYNLCSRSKYTCYPLWCITRVALDV